MVPGPTKGSSNIQEVYMLSDHVDLSPKFCRTQMMNNKLDSITLPSGLFNIAMENPTMFKNVNLFLWAMASMAMLVITRGKCL